MVRHAAIGLALLCSSMPISGCARFQVHVDVLDPNYTQSIQYQLGLRQIINESIVGDTSRPDEIGDELSLLWKNALIQTVDQFLGALEQEQAQLDEKIRALEASQALDDETVGAEILMEDARNTKIAGRIRALRQEQADIADILDNTTGIKSDVQDYTLTNFDKAFPDARSEIRTAFLDIACAGRAADKCDGAPNFESFEPLSSERATAVGRFRTVVSQRSKEVQDTVRAFYSRLLSAAPSGFAALNNTRPVLLAAQFRAVELESVGYLGANGSTLALSEIAFAAVDATANDKSKWARRYNTAEGIGVNGSTDIAIKLNSTADFSVKGMVFDARATALATRKLTTSAIQILASGAGMPIDLNQPKSSEEGGAALQAATHLSQAKAEVAAAEQRRSNYRAALKRIALEVIAAGQAIETAPAASKSATADKARKKAKRLFDANSSLLAPKTD